MMVAGTERVAIWREARHRQFETASVLASGAAAEPCFVALSRPAQAGREPQRSVSGSAPTVVQQGRL